MSGPRIKDGDWIVIISRWRIDVQQAIKITAQLVFYQDDYYKRQSRVRISDVVFAGPEPIARKLAEQLKSSDAQRTEDSRAAARRQEHRDAEFIAKANLAATAGLAS